jgi:ATP adenylyltransferase
MSDILQLAREVSITATTSGALVPIGTDYCAVTDHNIDFVVRIASNLDRRKQAATIAKADATKVGANKSDPPPNPFLPYDPSLWVADIGEHHAVLLNKFNVIDNHLLIVTKHYEHQDQLLTVSDLSAIAALVTQQGGLGFYNGGAVAGASQHHKHLQWVPGIELHGRLSVPVEPHFPIISPGHWQLVSAPFPMALAKIAPHSDLASQYINFYRDITRQLGIDTGAIRASRPYNLLLTPSHLWIVPRAAEGVESISLNAMAFAGSLFVKNIEQLEILKRGGLLAALHKTAARTPH